MIPKLYQKDGTTLIGTLTNCIECLVEEERNGIFEVTLQYPNNETISTSLVYDNIIICDSNDTLKNQKFRIYDTRRMMNNTIEVYARHISFDLAYDHIDSIDITNQSCEYALNTIFRNSQFSTSYVGHSDIINAQNYKISNCNALEAIAGKQGSIIDTYGTGAEILRDNTNIYVYNKRGNDNEVSIEYAKNLTGFELQENTDDLITRIIPFATYTPEGGTQTRVDGPTCNSQYINNYSHPFIAEIDFSDKFEDNEVPTASKLQTLAEQYFNNNKCDLPKQNWKIEFIPLSKCVGYEGIEDAISLCDTVTIKDTRYNINTKAKVIKTAYDVLRERYDSMELGEPRTTLGDIVNTGSEKGEQGPPGPQGPKGEDGNIGDFPDSLPAKSVLRATLLGFASIQLDWTYENQPYYWYEVYASKEKDFTPNVFDIIHKGQTSSYLYQAKPGETWYFRVCAINSYGRRNVMSDQVEVVTTLVDNLENYFTTAAIGQAVVRSLTAEYMTAEIIKGYWIDAKNLSVTDGNGKRTLDIDSFGNVNLQPTSMKVLIDDKVEFIGTQNQRNMALYGGQVCVFDSTNNNFLSTLGAIIAKNYNIIGSGFILSKNCNHFIISRDSEWEDIYTNREPSPTTYFDIDFNEFKIKLGVQLLTGDINLQGNTLYDVNVGYIKDWYGFGWRLYDDGYQLLYANGHRIVINAPISFNGNDLMAPNLYTDKFQFTNGHQVFIQNPNNPVGVSNGSHWDWQGFDIINAVLRECNTVTTIEATSAQTYALRTMALNDEESYSDPTSSTITDIYGVQSLTNGDVRWSDKQTYFTSEVEEGIYEAYVEIPWWLAQNIELDYHVNITPVNGFYQYYVSERDTYYFCVRSDKDSMGFTFELAATLLD